MALYSLKSPYEQDKNFNSDRNLFVTELLKDASVDGGDYASDVSIRSTVLDFIDEAAMQAGASDTNSSVVEQIITMLATDNFS